MATETTEAISSKLSRKAKLLQNLAGILRLLRANTKKLQTFNGWLAQKFHLPPQLSQRLIEVEITALLVGGATMIQLGEYALAAAFWVVVGLIWISKVISWKTISGDRKRIFAIKVFNVTLALFFVVAMIVWTNIKRGDEYWTALQKLFTRNELVVLTVATNREYALGTVINGILWQPDYTELDVVVNNPSESNYDDLNVVIRPDYPVAQIAQMSNLSDVSFEDKMGITARVTQEEAPLYPPSAPFGPASPYVLLATNVGYRVHCGRIPPRSSLRLVLALIDIKKSIPYKSGMALPPPTEMELSMELSYPTGESYWFALPGTHKYAARPNPRTLTIDGSYIIEGQRRRIKKALPIK